MPPRRLQPRYSACQERDRTRHPRSSPGQPCPRPRPARPSRSPVPPRPLQTDSFRTTPRSSERPGASSGPPAAPSIRPPPAGRAAERFRVACAGLDAPSARADRPSAGIRRPRAGAGLARARFIQARASREQTRAHSIRIRVWTHVSGLFSHHHRPAQRTLRRPLRPGPRAVSRSRRECHFGHVLRHVVARTSPGTTRFPIFHRQRSRRSNFERSVV
jgi:hypothetical protein